MAKLDENSAIDYEGVNWDDLSRRLLKYARHKWAVAAVSGIQPSIEPSDLVQEAIADLYEKKRAWDGIMQHLFPLLCEVIRSKISNMARANRDRVRQSYAEDGPEKLEEAIISHTEDDPEYSVEAAVARSSPSAESVYWRFFELRNSHEAAIAFYESLADEEKLHKIVGAIIFDDCVKPAQIDAHCKLRVENVYNDIKTLHRRLTDFYSERKGN